MVLGINLERQDTFAKIIVAHRPTPVRGKTQRWGFGGYYANLKVGRRKKRIESHLALFSGSVGLTPYAKGRSSNKKGY